MSRFIKELERCYPQVCDPVPPWDLNLILSRPLASCSLLFLSWKAAFLVAITSARRVSELTLEPPYTVFFRDKVQQCPHPDFLPKVSQFHVNQDIFLPVFFPKLPKTEEERRLHSLDVRRALAFYIDRTSPFHKSTQFFVAITDKIKGLLESSQRISSWITTCIQAFYEQAKVLPPAIVKAHSMRAQGSSGAFVAHILIQDSCRAVTWSSVHMFASHYAITQQVRDYTNFGRAVLQLACP